jgi:hypothetical protein
VTQQHMYDMMTQMLQVISRVTDDITEAKILLLKEDIDVLQRTVQYAFQQQDQMKLERLCEEVLWLGQEVGQAVFDL